MGLYLCVFDHAGDDEELEGVDVGLYEDFGRLRSTVAQCLEPHGWGSRFPVLMSHPDSDGQWSPQEAVILERELRAIDAELSRFPAQPLPPGWQSEVARSSASSQPRCATASSMWTGSRCWPG